MHTHIIGFSVAYEFAFLSRCRCHDGQRFAHDEICHERKRERERETAAAGGLANCKGKEDGWGAGGWSWRRKRYGRFCPKIPVPNALFVSFCVFRGRNLWQFEVRNLKLICPEKGMQNILEYND